MASPRRTSRKGLVLLQTEQVLSVIMLTELTQLS